MHTNTFCKYRKNYSHRLACILLIKGLIFETFISSGTVPLIMHLFIIMDNVGDITADSILMVSVEIPSCPVLFLFGNLDIMHITSCVVISWK